MVVSEVQRTTALDTARVALFMATDRPQLWDADSSNNLSIRDTVEAKAEAMAAVEVAGMVTVSEAVAVKMVTEDVGVVALVAMAVAIISHMQGTMAGNPT